MTNCETCGRAVPTGPGRVRVTCRGDVRPGQPSIAEIGHDFREEAA